MATQVKTTKEERNYKPAHAAQPAKKKTDTRKIVKALIFGPTIATLIMTLVYIALWGFSKAFSALHAVVTAYLVPWVTTNWPIIVGIWALISLTSVVFHFVEQYQNEMKKVKKQSENKKQSEKGDQPGRKQVRKTEITSTIYDISDEEISEEELESVGAFSYTPEVRDFSKEIDEIFGKTRRNSNPDDLISLGKHYNSEETEA